MLSKSGTVRVLALSAFKKRETLDTLALSSLEKCEDESSLRSIVFGSQLLVDFLGIWTYLVLPFPISKTLSKSTFVSWFVGLKDL